MNKYELLVGAAVEMEHTSDKKEALKIAKDHVKEDPIYYTKLGKAGLIDEPAAIALYNKYLKESVVKLTEDVLRSYVKEELSEASIYKWSIQNIKKFFEDYAIENNHQIQHMRTEKGSWMMGGRRNDYYYQIGSVLVMARNGKSPGYNDVEVFVLKSDDPIKGVRFLDEMGFKNKFHDAFEEQAKKSNSSSKTLSSREYKKAIEDIIKGGKGQNLSDNEAYDIVDGVFADYVGLEDYIKKTYKVEDAQGWLADRI